ncbi:MAG: MFS transporter [Proteobacteria bacterium]|nr:MFS transporter [Pseudomonadota bacterium]
MFSPLADPTYRRLFGAQVIALVGTGLSTVALTLLAYELAGGEAGAVLGTALALKMVAYVGIAPFVGGIAHRLPRKALLVGLDVARVAFVLCLPFVDAVWQVYVLIFLLNACSAGFTPTFQAAIPDVLPDEDRYTKALSLSRLAYDLENLLSPTLAALLLTMVRYDALFAANGAAFIVSASLVLSVRLPRPTPSDRPASVLFNLTYGVRSYLATPRLRGLLLLSLAVAAAGAMVIVNTVVYVRGTLGGSDTDAAVALAAAGAGSMLAAVLLPLVLERHRERPVMLAGGVLMGLGLVLGLTSPGFLALLPVWFLLGVGSSLVQTPTGRLLRASCQPADRSAFFSAQFALSHACWLVTYPLAGWLGAAASLPVTFGCLAGLVFAATLAAVLVWPRETEVALDHVHEQSEHEHRHVHDEHHRHEHEGWEGPEPHSHPHRHRPVMHRHHFVIDFHHRQWPA